MSLTYLFRGPMSSGQPLFSFLFFLLKGFFDVDADTGEVRVASRLNRDAAAVVMLTTVVTDVSAIPAQTGFGESLSFALATMDYLFTHIVAMGPS